MSAIKYQKTGEFGIIPFATKNPARPGCRVPVSLLEFEGGEIPALGTTLANSNLNVIRKSPYWDNHVFAGVDDGPAGFMMFVFNPPLVGTPQTLTPFNKYDTTVEFTWPSVLIDIGIVRSTTQYASGAVSLPVGVAPKYLHVEKLVGHPTKCIIEEFTSPVPFSDELTVIDPPVPTPIDLYVDGINVRFPACLHPAISAESRWVADAAEDPTSYVSYSFLDLLEQSVGVDLNTPYFSPATNHLRWRNFVKDFVVEKRANNEYYGQRLTYVAPPPGRKIFS